MPTLSKSLSLGAPIPLTTSSILVVLGGLALAYAVVRAIHLAFFGDLAKIPGPLICKFTGLVDTYQTLVGARRSTWIHSLHLKYGESLCQTASIRFEVVARMWRSAGKMD